ncbi:MAG: sigma-70 family RNA polymerase sigma factor [Oscillospiraceae bacterium]|jgi:RNA polymerase sigma-70 factor (ECF subfamily)|nr:sigma-70 family RNA polymerase sigma factor [Oscillospiraceae bacterium]
MEDTAIIDLYWLRSEDAIQETAAKYGAYCRSIARGLLANAQDEEECVSDTWIRAWNAMPDERPNRLKLFLGKITRRLACDALRSRTAQKRGGGVYVEALEELGECVPSVPGADRIVEDRELEEVLDRFLRTLPERDCNVFLRRYWYGETLEEAARRYGMKLNTVKTSLYRSREKLRKYLEKEGVAL